MALDGGRLSCASEARRVGFCVSLSSCNVQRRQPRRWPAVAWRVCILRLRGNAPATRGIRCFAVSCLFMGALVLALPRSSLLLLPPLHTAMCPAPSPQMPASISRGQSATGGRTGSHSCVLFCTEPVCTRSGVVHRHTCPRLGRTATPKGKKGRREGETMRRVYRELQRLSVAVP